MLDQNDRVPFWPAIFTNARKMRAQISCRYGFDADAGYCLDRIDGDNRYTMTPSTLAQDIVGAQPMSGESGAFMHMQMKGYPKGELCVIVSKSNVGKTHFDEHGKNMHSAQPLEEERYSKVIDSNYKDFDFKVTYGDGSTEKYRRDTSSNNH